MVWAGVRSASVVDMHHVHGARGGEGQASGSRQAGAYLVPSDEHEPIGLVCLLVCPLIMPASGISRSIKK